MCLETGPEDSRRRCGSDMFRQTVPDTSSGDRTSGCSECPMYSSETDSALQCLNDLWKQISLCRALRKAGTEWRFPMWGGIWFQILGPQTEKARFPNWVRVLLTTAALVVEERRWRHLGNIPATSGNKPHYWPRCQSLFAYYELHWLTLSVRVGVTAGVCLWDLVDAAT